MLKPFRYYIITKYCKLSNPVILDIGAGSNSPSIAKQWFPNSNYTGIDINENYNNNKADFEAMDKFVLMDLTQLNFDQLPNNTYDIIIMSHIIEHLHNGDKVIEGLLPKLKKDGLIYIEFPSEKSVGLPSMRETLNFFDDDTHCRIYSLKEICNLLMRQHITVLKAGPRKQWLNIALMPIKIVVHLLTKGYVRAGAMWDYYGFADYVIATKKIV
jgi:SAM-dependent methyltransferase